MKFVFGREYVNVFYEGKQVKFLGELSPPYFYAKGDIYDVGRLKSMCAHRL